VTKRIDPSDIEELNDFLGDVARIEPYEPRNIDDWFYLCTETVSAGIDGEYFSEKDVGYEVRDVTTMPSYDGKQERELLRTLKRKLNRLKNVKSTSLEEEKASIAGAEGHTRLILVLQTPSGELRYRIEDWDGHWESYSVGGMF
jgi:hypothetical protein